MKMSKREYQKYVEKMSPDSPCAGNLLRAFLFGGLICCVGQALTELFTGCLELPEEDAATVCSITLIFLGAFFTGLGLYDRLAKHAGAGTLVPITGFANSVVSPAMEFRAEGFVTGMAVKMFSIAGPVIVFGVSASVVYGIIYWLMQL